LTDSARRRRVASSARAISGPSAASGQPSSGCARRWIHRHNRLEDNTDARVVSFMHEAGLVKPTMVKRAKTLFVFGLGYYQASSPKA
jgi:hypothetical protein